MGNWHEGVSTASERVEAAVEQQSAARRVLIREDVAKRRADRPVRRVGRAGELATEELTARP